MFNIFFIPEQTLQTFLRVRVEVELLVHLNNITDTKGTVGRDF